MRLHACAVLLVLLLALPSAGRAGNPDLAYRETAARFHGLKTGRQTSAAQWRGVARSFEAIFASAPTHPRGADGLYSAGLSLRAALAAGGGGADRAGALALFRLFVRKYPNHRLADDSLMHIGALYASGKADGHRAFLSYREVLATYPEGDQALLASRRAAALAGRAAAPRAPAAGSAPAGGDSAGNVAKKPQPPVKPPAPPPPSVAAAPRGVRPAGATARLKRVLFSSLADFTRVILTADSAVSYRHGELPRRDGRRARFYLDLAGARPVRGLAAEYAVGDGVVEKIRISRHTPDVTRIVFDLNSQGRFQVKKLDLPYEKKIIVDLYPAVRPKPAPPPERPVAAVPGAGISLRNTLGLKVNTLVIDPGHGGRDPGAVAFGVKEKHVALRLSRELRAVFAERRPEIRVELTRDRDVFIPLGRRPAIARKEGADLFVSIHLNANPREGLSGIETYFLNLTSDNSALRVAARENASTEKHVSDLQIILHDLLRDTNIVESSKLANALQTSLVTGLRRKYQVRDLGVKQAPFMVLIGAEMPSVLVEAGFLTNRRENRRLQSRNYLRKIAVGIYEGLRKYIQQQNVAVEAPPPVKVTRRQDS